MKLEDSVLFKEVVLTKIRFGLTQIENCYPQNLRYETEHDIRLQRIIHHISWNLLGKEIETKKYPETWWDAFKERWYPKFLKKRFPVRWDHFRLYNICPHINEVWMDDKALHLNWIENELNFAVVPKE